MEQTSAQQQAASDNNGTDWQTQVVYAGFWIRTGAALIDAIIVGAVTTPLTLSLYPHYYEMGDVTFFHGPGDFLVNLVLPIFYSIVFWVYKDATPGKMLCGIKIVDARTGGKPGGWQYIGRYFSYIASTLPLMLGFFWIIWDKRKQGWHDKLARTVVIRKGR